MIAHTRFNILGVSKAVLADIPVLDNNVVQAVFLKLFAG